MIVVDRAHAVLRAANVVMRAQHEELQAYFSEPLAELRRRAGLDFADPNTLHDLLVSMQAAWTRRRRRAMWRGFLRGADYADALSAVYLLQGPKALAFMLDDEKQGS